MGNSCFVCSSNYHNWKHVPVLLRHLQSLLIKTLYTNILQYRRALTTNNYCGSDSRSPGCWITSPYPWIMDGAFEDNSQIPECLKRRTALSFITSQTRTGAWSCLHFSLCDTSSLSSMPPPNPLLSQLYPCSTTTTPRSSPPLLHCTQTQRDASCNHCWTQFQGQFEDYLLSLVNNKKKKTGDKHFLNIHLKPIDIFINGSLR